jgi:phage FluMu gp28-like protein
VLAKRAIIPALTAHTPAGQIIRAWDYKQKKNLVVAFVHAGCARFIGSLATRAAELAECEAVVLAIFPELPPATLRENLPAQIVMAADVTGHSQRAYLGDDAFGAAGQELVGVFVADRYGELYVQWSSRSEDGLPGVVEVIDRLRQIQVACEECGVSDWPAGD